MLMYWLYTPLPRLILPSLFCARDASCSLGGFGQLADVADIAPGLAAGVEGEEDHLAVLRQAFEHAQVMRWQGADAEYHQAFGQLCQRLWVVQTGQQLAEQARAVRVAVLGQLGPEQRLPGLVRAEVAQLAALPGGQPVVAVEQVLVVDVGNARGQGQPAALVATVEVTRQTRRPCQVVRLAQPVIYTPGQWLGIEGRGGRQLAQHFARQLPDEAGRQLHFQLHDDALLARQLQGQPAPHALARHHHPGRRQRVAHRLGKQRGGQLAEAFQVIGVIQVEHGRHPFAVQTISQKLPQITADHG